MHPTIGAMRPCSGPGCNRRPGGEETVWARRVRFQEILRRLAIIDEGFVEDQAGLGLGLPASRFLDPKTAALVQVGALVAIGSPGVCLEWGTTRALAAGATEDEITDVLLAIAPVAGLGRVTGAVPAWRPHWGMTSRPRCWTQMITNGCLAPGRARWIVGGTGQRGRRADHCLSLSCCPRNAVATGDGNTYIRAMPVGSRAITMTIKARRPYEATKGRGEPWPQHRAPAGW